MPSLQSGEETLSYSKVSLRSSPRYVEPDQLQSYRYILRLGALKWCTSQLHGFPVREANSGDLLPHNASDSARREVTT